MANKFFGQYLLERGLISRAQLMKALDHQKPSKVPIGVLAMERKHLTTEQFVATQVEATSSGRTFWEVALARRLLSKDQVVELFREQVNNWKLLGEVLVELGLFDPARLDDLVHEYHRDVQGSSGAGGTPPARLPHQPIVDAFHGVTVSLFGKLLSLPVKTTAIGQHPANGGTCDAELLVVQRVGGNTEFWCGLAMPAPVYLFVASQLTSAPQMSPSPLVFEAAAELASMITGNACVKLGVAGIRLSPEPPRAIRRGEPMPCGGNRVQADLTSPQGDFQLRLYLP